MIQYLKGSDLKRPARIDAPPGGGTSVALATSDFERGTITLLGPKGDVTLVWDGTRKDRRRGLEPGVYRLRTTRLVRTRKNDSWFLSATGPAGKKVEYEAGKEQTLKVAAEVHFKGLVRRRAGGLQLGMQIKDATGRGLSVYKSAKRVVVTYVVLDSQGKELSSGSMNYG